ncbi:MAG: TIGR03067 domain-containing protein [Planctomycetes bacterium]|nr:TIGR03067 domain-containing protein [Planctomycetota bacterium]
MRAFLVLALFSPLALAVPVTKEKDTPKDEIAILGIWQIEQFDAGGEKVPPEVNQIQFVFAKEGKFSLTNGPRDRGAGTFKLDPSAKVKTLDITVDGTTMLAIYELDGDTLKLCIPDKPNSPRPEEFKADSGARIAVVTFKRVKDTTKDK